MVSLVSRGEPVVRQPSKPKKNFGALDTFSNTPGWMPDLGLDLTGKNILDVGCGNGRDLTRPVYENAAEYLGIDPDERSIEIGQRSFPGLRLSCGYAEHMPFPDGYFDLVTAQVSLPYADLPQAYREIARVLKPGGHIQFALHDWHWHWIFLRRALRERAWKRVLDLGYVTFASLVYAVSGFIPPKPWSGIRETVQCAFRERLELRRAGFESMSFEHTPIRFIVRAVRLAVVMHQPTAVIRSAMNTSSR